jgi:hypothetical protein
MGTQPSTEAILLSGRGLFVVKEWWPPDGDGRLLKTKAGCSTGITRRMAAVVCFGRCRNSAKTLNTWLYILQSCIFVWGHRNKTATHLVVCIRQWIHQTGCSCGRFCSWWRSWFLSVKAYMIMQESTQVPTRRPPFMPGTLYKNTSPGRGGGCGAWCVAGVACKRTVHWRLCCEMPSGHTNVFPENRIWPGPN